MRSRFPPLRSESDALRNLDLLRLAAASAIMFLHFSDYVPRAPGGPGLHLRFLSLSVDLFFTISGFVICFVYAGRMASWSDYTTFMRRRAARLVPLHWATLLFFCLVGIAMLLGVAVEGPQMYNFRCLLPNFLMLHSLGICDQLTFNYASWSISAEMLIYLVFPLLAFALLRRPLLCLLLAAGAIALDAALAPASMADSEKFWVNFMAVWGLQRALPSFLIGMAFYALKDRLARLPAPQLGMYLTIAAFLVLGLTGTRPFALLPLIYLIAAFAIAADAQGRIGRIAARLSVGGQLTYSTYMLHPVVGVLLLSFLGRELLHLGTAGEIALAVLSGGVVFGVAYLSLVWFETPMRSWISGSRQRAPETPQRPFPAAQQVAGGSSSS